MGFIYKISIDLVNANYISGWCFHRFRQTKQVQLELYLDDRMIAQTTANLLREDLAELTIHPNGRCGFELVINDNIDQSSGSRLILKAKGSNSILAEIDTDGIVIKDRRSAGTAFKELLLFGKVRKPSIIFMHVPKTAGTSFNTLVHSLLPRDRIISHMELLDRRQYNQLPSRYRYLSGHLRVGVLKDHFFTEEAELYTIVREPYAHIHSHLKWLIKTATAAGDSYFKHSNPIIYDLGQRLKLFDFQDIEALAQFAREITGVEAAFFDNMQTRYFLDYEVQRVGGSDLKHAFSNVPLFTLIGLTEDYFSFVDAFRKRHNLRKPILKDKLNRSPMGILFDYQNDSVQEALHPLVRFDLELYEHIRNMRRIS